MAQDRTIFDSADPLSPPIPTYEEATSSRYLASHLGPSEVSDDAERQGLLAPADHSPAPASRRRNGYYQPPSVQSVRSSEDSLDGLGRDSFDDDDADDDEERELRREIEEMDVDDSEAADPDRRRRERMRRVRSRFSKRFTSISARLSNLHLPSFNLPRPSFSFITSRIRIPEGYKPSWPIIARLFGLFGVVALVYALFVSEIFPMGRGAMSGAFNPVWVRAFAQGSVNQDRIRDYLQHITAYDHVAGSEGSLYMAKWIEGIFRSSNMDDVAMLEYGAYLNWPKKGGRKVAITSPPELAWQAKLEEENVYDHPTPQQQQIMAFHALSKSGNASGPLIYVNYGTRADFKRLEDSGIDVSGSIILVRYMGHQSDAAGKVKAAQDAGAVGCLIYSDPKDDGFRNGNVWPDGRYRPADSLQRESVALTGMILGDVLTPGKPSRPTVHRISKENNPGLVKIPSIPLSWRDAQKLLQALKGHGQKLPDEWHGGVPDVEWWSGDKASPTVFLQNEQDEEEKQSVFNVLGVIEGVETKQKKIVIGNHRDSWCFGSADPGSGTAVMLEVISIFSELRIQGWRPLRSIYFASWDAGEYNKIGSTEFVEDHIDDLRENALAYINIDAGVLGDHFRASGSPVFHRALLQVLNRVDEPLKNTTLRAMWESNKRRMEDLGASSDYAAFQDLAGCSSIDIGFDGPPLPYHSCYETFEWMERFGDPGFHYHKALAQVLVLLILELAQEPIVPFDFASYANYIKSWINDLEKYASAKGAPWNADDKSKPRWDIAPLMKAANTLERNSNDFHEWEQQWERQVYGSGGFETNSMAMMRISHNTRMSNFETHLLDLPRGYGDEIGRRPPPGRIYGIPGREQYKHIFFGPDIHDGYTPSMFPAIRDAIEIGNWTEAQYQVDKAARILSGASEKLLH